MLRHHVSDLKERIELLKLELVGHSHWHIEPFCGSSVSSYLIWYCIIEQEENEPANTETIDDEKVTFSVEEEEEYWFSSEDDEVKAFSMNNILYRNR